MKLSRSSLLFFLLPLVSLAQPMYSLHNHADRLTAFVQSRLDWFLKDGSWNGPEHMRPNRALEPLAMAHVYLEEGSPVAVEQANRYLETTQLLEWYRAGYLYLKYGDKLSDRSKANILRILDSMQSGYLEDDWDFVGVNDNFPCMASAGCALYGRIRGNDLHRAKAMERLKQFRDQLTRCGAQTEYSSQAYAFLQIEGIAMIAEMAEDPELRALARDIEKRLWFDVLSHVYLPAMKMTGPSARSYAWDMRGCGLAYGMLDRVLGPHFIDRDLDDYFRQSEQWIMARNAACYGVEYHCPQELVDFLLNREYPFRFRAVADGGPSASNQEMDLLGITLDERDPEKDDGLKEYPAWSTRIETYMTEAYSVGSSTTPYHSGNQTENFLIVYPRPGGLHDVATVYCRTVINDMMVLDGPTDGYGDKGIVFSELGRKFAVQEKDMGMVLTSPKPAFRKNLTSLRTSIFIPHNDWTRGENPIDSIWVGNAPVSGNAYIGDRFEPVLVEDNGVYMAFFPLVGKDLGSSSKVAVEEQSGYTIISFYNYAGPPITLDERGMMTTGGGFGFVVASAAEYKDFDEFRLAMGTVETSDRYRASVHYRKNSTRTSSITFNGQCLEFAYSPVSEGIRYITLNGRPQPRPVSDVSGINGLDLPFISEPHGNRLLDIYGNQWRVLTDPETGLSFLLFLVPDTKEWRSLPSEESPPSPVDSIIPDHRGALWANNESQLWRRDLRREEGWSEVHLEDGFPAGRISTVSRDPGKGVVLTFADGRVYACDLDESGNLEIRPYAGSDRQATAWSVAGELPWSNHDLRGAVLNGRLYVAGGRTAEYGFPPRSFDSNHLFEFDPVSGKVRIAGTLPTKRVYNGTAAFKNKIWVVGGRKTAPGIDEPCGDVDIWDPETGEFTSGPGLNHAYPQPVVDSLGNRLYAIGFVRKPNSDQWDPKGMVESIGPGESSWRIEGELPFGPAAIDGCSLGSFIYVMAAKYGFYRYNPLSGEWDASLPQLPDGLIPRSAAMVAAAGRVWVIGGRDIPAGNQVFSFDPLTAQWHTHPPFPRPISWAAAGVIGEWIYVFGGAAGRNYSNLVYGADVQDLLEKSQNDLSNGFTHFD